MCHINAATYQAYINQRIQCDTVAAFLGRPSNKALLKAAGHMSRYVDPRAPTTAAHHDLESIKTDPTLVKLIELRDTLSQEVRRQSGSIREAEVQSTKLYQMYRTVENKVRSTRAYLQKLAKATTRQQFFNTVNTAEINLQLNDETSSFLDLGSNTWNLQPSYSLKERRMLAELICTDTCNLDDDVRLKHRIYTTNSMILLGREREIRRVKVGVKAGVKAEVEADADVKDMPEADDFPQSCDINQCFICFWDTGVPQSQRLNKFCSPYRARDHLISRHLKGLGGRSVLCPEPRCRNAKNTFNDLQSFKAHLARVHNYNNFNRYKDL